jgi:hypothetical protein
VQPTIGRIVHYKLSTSDAAQINQRRYDSGTFRRGLGYPIESGEPGRTGHIEHTGNGATGGEVYPAMIVRVWGETTTTVQLQVFLDGNDTYWATSRILAEDPAGEPGRWHWPPRAEHQPGDRPATY